MGKQEQIIKEIQNVVALGDVKNSRILIDQYKKIIGYNDEIASIEAIINIYENKYEVALNCVRDGLKYNILNSDLYYIMGDIYLQLKEYNRSFLCYEKALFYCKDKNNEIQIKESISELKRGYDLNVHNISIIIFTNNNFDYLKTCINSIRTYCNSDTYEIIIVDNNSTDGTVEWLKQQSDIKAIYNDRNIGISKGYNQGIKIADKNNDIMILSNDAIVMENSIFNMRMALYSEEKIGAAGAVSNNASYNQSIDKKYDDASKYIEYSTINNITDQNRYESRLKLSDYAMLIKRECLNKIGLFDERFFEYGLQDDDISFRILKNNYKNILCLDSFILKINNSQFAKVSEENNKKFIDKWGFSAAYSSGIRSDVITMIQDKNDKPIRVLEVGCACGATLLKIKNLYKNAELYGIELNEKSADIAKINFDVRAENIENINLSYEEGYFDYIIFADVLEHLYNPNLVIRNMKKYLKKDGCIIASIPNVKHYSVVMSLIYGNWTYQDWGILDRTHVRFFTLNEINKMFNSEGYNINSIMPINIGVTKQAQEFINNIKKMYSDINSDEFLAWQYIVKAKKSK